MATQFAVNRIIDSVWTVGFTMDESGKAIIECYDRDITIGYADERKLPIVELVENSDRYITSLKLVDRNTGKEQLLEVANQQHIFTYGTFIKKD